jgi:2-polyprenyl-6-methoxyphenol hydroxylase-like FAD-dependent oxidoreductase
MGVTMAGTGRILIVGSGIGGLSAAIALRRVGFHVELFEQSTDLREVGAGVGLWSNAMSSLDELGVGEALRSGSTPLRIMTAATSRGETLSRCDLDTLGPEFASAACFVVLRPRLLAALAARVPVSSIHAGRHALGVKSHDEYASVHFEGDRVESGDLVIGADGLHSVARSSVVGNDDDIRYSGQTCFRGVARLRVEERALGEIQGRGQRGAVCAIDSETAYWWVAYNAPMGSVVEQQARREHLLQRYRGWPSTLEQAISATPSDAILQNDLVDRAPAQRYARGRVVLLGDAAHPTTPNLGQGANMAIDDAIALARALRDESDVPRALARYEHERLPRTRRIVEQSWDFGRVCTWESALAVWIRERMLRLTPRAALRRMLRSQIIESVGRL